MAHFKNPIVWLRSFLASVISGAATSLNSWLGMAAAKYAGIDVPSLNINAIGVIFVFGAITGGVTYLMKSPLPEIEETTFIQKP